MYYDIEDPQGFTHRVLVEKGEAYGAENLAHAWQPEQRKSIITAVVTAAHKQQPLPHGFQLKGTLP